ncbi:hypothetical protein [Bradyrhizobium sp. USDA 313]|uniref:hypothetical protein n=1 Tax=Bradyrhizobium sp. USDA 313 TaxID=3156307 RepID=UPI003515298D
MTAVNIAASKRHSRIIIATDAASYYSNGVVSEFRSKVRAVPEWPAVITGRGNAYGQDVAARELSRRASNFDELISIVSRDLPLIVEEFRLDQYFELILAGFFNKQPMVFFIRTPGEHNSMGDWPAYFACPVGPTLFGPWPSADLIAAAGFVNPDPDNGPEQIASGLRELLELQRRTPAEDGFSRVGGYAEITTITPMGIDQQILCRWPEDRIGHRMSTLNREH